MDWRTKRNPPESAAQVPLFLVWGDGPNPHPRLRAACYGVVYLVTNMVNGKRYVGQTVGRHPRQRWGGHIVLARRAGRREHPISMAIRKYGAEHFAFEVIASARNKEDLHFLERLLIVQWGTRKADGGHGYNSTIGGESGPDNAREVMRARAADPVIGAKMRATARRTITDPVIREKATASLREYWDTLTPEEREERRALSEASARRPETRAKQRAHALRNGLADRMRDPEVRKRALAAAVAARLENCVGANHHAARPCVVEGRPFDTVTQAEAALGIGKGLVRHRIKRGYPGYFYSNEGQRPFIEPTRQDYTKGPAARPVLAEGAEYPTLAMAARALGRTTTCIKGRIVSEWPGYRFMDGKSARPIGAVEDHRKARSIMAGGQADVSAAIAAQFLGRTESSGRSRIRGGDEGWFYADEGQRPRKSRPTRPVEVDGVTYRTAAEAGKAYGVTGPAVKAWIARGQHGARFLDGGLPPDPQREKVALQQYSLF